MDRANVGAKQRQREEQGAKVATRNEIRLANTEVAREALAMKAKRVDANASRELPAQQFLATLVGQPVDVVFVDGTQLAAVLLAVCTYEVLLRDESNGRMVLCFKHGLSQIWERR